MNFLDINGLATFLGQLKNVFGKKATLDRCSTERENNLLNIDYDKELAFDTSRLVTDNAPYVGSAVVGSTYVT